MVERMRTDSASTRIDAAPGTVYAALTEAQALAEWLPPIGMTGEIHEFDASPGGAFKMTLTYQDPASAPGKSTRDSDVIAAKFGDLVPNERVVWLVRFSSDDPAFAGIMRMTWSIRSRAEGCEVSIVAEDVPPGISREDHLAGLNSSLQNLAGYLKRRHAG